MVISHGNDFLTQQGIPISNHLIPFIKRVRFLLDNSHGKPGWNSEAKSQVQSTLAISLYRLGEEIGEYRLIMNAIEIYRLSLKEDIKEHAPLRWAATQNNLGIALRELGRLEGSTFWLEEAVAACRLALQVRTKDRAAMQWAMTQNNLNNAYTALERLQSSTL